jgi:hypothetical protein
VTLVQPAPLVYGSHLVALNRFPLPPDAAPA